MKLTKAEQKICDKYSERDNEGLVHCFMCPLAIGNPRMHDFTCYANIDGRTKHAKEVERF